MAKRRNHINRKKLHYMKKELFKTLASLLLYLAAMILAYKLIPGRLEISTGIAVWLGIAISRFITLFRMYKAE